MESIASPVRGGTDRTLLPCPRDGFLPALGAEHYVLLTGLPIKRDAAQISPASSSCKFAPLSPKAQRKPRQTMKFEHVHFYLDGRVAEWHSFERVQFSHNQRQDQQSPAS